MTMQKWTCDECGCAVYEEDSVRRAVKKGVSWVITRYCKGHKGGQDGKQETDKEKDV